MHTCGMCTTHSEQTSNLLCPITKETSTKSKDKRISGSLLASSSELATQEAELAKWKHGLNLSDGGGLIRAGDNLPDWKVRCASSLVENYL